jgi:hypothetical protein
LILVPDRRNIIQFSVSLVSSKCLDFFKGSLQTYSLEVQLNKVQQSYRSLSIGAGFTKHLFLFFQCKNISGPKKKKKKKVKQHMK